MKKINCILLVDDDFDDNEFHELIISESGVCKQIRIAVNGIKALEYMTNAANSEMQQSYPKPDLIFLDINMPKMNGFEFLEAYHKSDVKLKVQPVICMLTTSINPDDKIKAFEIHNIQEFERKPLSAEMLIKIIDKYF